MRSIAALLSSVLLLFATASHADSFFSTDARGRPTAHFPVGRASSFDVFMDVQDGAGNSLCLGGLEFPPSPCFPADTAPATRLISREFDDSFFDIFFEVSMDGAPLPVTGAGLNQSHTATDSFFDVFFEVDLGGGKLQQAVLGFAYPDPGPPGVPGAIAWPPGVGTSPGPPNSFFLDPQAFAPFQITLQPGPFLLGLAPPPLTPNPNLVPEPGTLFLLGSGLAGYGIKKRFRKA